MLSALLLLSSVSVTCVPSAEGAKVVCRLVYARAKHAKNRTYENEIRPPGKSSYPLPPEKNFERAPREIQCSDRSQTSTIMSGRDSPAKTFIFSSNGARTKIYHRKQTKVHKYSYHTHLLTIVALYLLISIYTYLHSPIEGVIYTYTRGLHCGGMTPACGSTHVRNG